MSSLETLRTTARAALVSLSYCSDPGSSTPALSRAELPTDPAVLALIRRSSWRLPEVDGRTVRFEAMDGSAAVAFDFDARGGIERVAVVAAVRSCARSRHPRQPDSTDEDDRST
jgi:hypothetical protein